MVSVCVCVCVIVGMQQLWFIQVKVKVLFAIGGGWVGGWGTVSEQCVYIHANYPGRLGKAVHKVLSYISWSWLKRT